MTPPAAHHRRLRSTSAGLSAAVAAWVLLTCGAAVLLAHSQHTRRAEIDQRFGARADLAGRFVSTYVAGLMQREAQQGARYLAAREPTAGDLARISGADGFSAAVLLDRTGRLLQVVPARPGLIDRDLTRSYAHLAAAVAGRATISKVVPSVARRLPVVAFAMPFDTPSGRRVFSGAQAVGTSPAGNYLRNAVTIPGARLYLVDSAGVVIATNGAQPRGLVRLGSLEPVLARRLARSRTGGFDRRGVAQRFTSGAVRGTPWRVVVVAPAAEIYAADSGAVRWLPWLVLVGFVAASLLALVLVRRVMAARRELARANEQLERIVRIDPLTGLLNRRGLEELLPGVTSAARRRGEPFSVLVVDADHFKRLNDTLGHLAGDVVLAGLGAVMQADLRSEDIIARWGGEEFILLLPRTDATQAAAFAERLRAAVESEPALRVTVSIGMATTVEEPFADVVHRADAALYGAKAAGRNRVSAEPLDERVDRAGHV